MEQIPEHPVGGTRLGGAFLEQGQTIFRESQDEGLIFVALPGRRNPLVRVASPLNRLPETVLAPPPRKSPPHPPANQCW